MIGLGTLDCAEGPPLAKAGRAGNGAGAGSCRLGRPLQKWQKAGL